LSPSERVGEPPGGIPTGKKGKEITKVLTLCTCFRASQGGYEIRSVTDDLLGNHEFQASHSTPTRRAPGFIFVKLGRLREVTLEWEEAGSMYAKVIHIRLPASMRVEVVGAAKGLGPILNQQQGFNALQVLTCYALSRAATSALTASPFSDID
jgi:hypothetical protein